MRKQLSLTGLVLLVALQAQHSAARDVQMRPTFDSDGNSVAAQGAAVSNTSTANLSTEERLQRLERMLNSQGLVDMLLRLDSLQNELQALRGELELHTHQLEEIKQRQRDLYVDIDRRLLQLERNGQVSGGPVLTPQTTAPGTAASAGAPAPVPVPAASSADEQKQYQKAFDLLRELRYEQAVKAFRDFLAQYPNGRYAHIAQYWIGEANYAQRNFQQAIGDYQKLITDHPNSPKLAEAMLKIGYSQYELKKYADAEKSLNTLIKSYPGTTEASQAKNLLTQMRLKRGG